MWRTPAFRSARRASSGALAGRARRGSAKGRRTILGERMSDEAVVGERSTHSVGAQAGARLDLYVASVRGLSRTQAATLIANGHVLVNGAAEKASYRALASDKVDVVVPPAPGRDIVPEDIPLTIVYEDDALLVVDKPAGMVVHPAPGNWTGTLVNALVGRGGELAEGSGEERPGLVHRLDKETSGLLVVAKTELAHRTLSAALASRAIRRRVCGTLLGAPPGRAHRGGCAARARSSGPTAHGNRQGREGGPHDVCPGGAIRQRGPVRAHLHTGRTHQIRVHFRRSGIRWWVTILTVEEADAGWRRFRRVVTSCTRRGFGCRIRFRVR